MKSAANTYAVPNPKRSVIMFNMSCTREIYRLTVGFTENDAIDNVRASISTCVPGILKACESAAIKGRIGI